MQKNDLWTLVTGGAKGVGAEICKTLAANGRNILIHYNTSHDEALIVSKTCVEFGVKTECVQGDFSSMDSLQLFIEKLIQNSYTINTLINNVGNYTVGSVVETNDKEWQALFQTNLHAPIALIRAFLPTLIQHKGAIINIGVAGINHVPADVYSSAYTASKLALWMTTRSLAKELASCSVKVNMVSPGLLENSIDRSAILHFVPMQRTGTLCEVARVIAFLLGSESEYITGQNIEVAGGLRLL